MRTTLMTDPAKSGWKVSPHAADNLNLFPGMNAVELTPGVVAPLTVTATGPLKNIPTLRRADELSGDSLHANVYIEMNYNEDLGQYLVQDIGMRMNGELEVTTVRLREIPPLRIARWVLPWTFKIDNKELDAHPAAFITPGSIGKVTGESAKPTLADAAVIYRLATAIRETAPNAVAASLGLAPRTAVYWIARAREEGYLQTRAEAREEQRRDELELLRDLQAEQDPR
ncbi:hypothetical protein [Microbacterium sp. NPDC076911]|uniref:hypothetical protein n=1 Tax=Microbacterium sp. NPDC076911 TaxID=3154958 RepID=UPI00341F1130